MTVHNTCFEESRVLLASLVVTNILSWYTGELGEAGEETRTMPGDQPSNINNSNKLLGYASLIDLQISMSDPS